MKKYLPTSLCAALVFLGIQASSIGQEAEKKPVSNTLKDPVVLLDAVPKELMKDMRPGSRGMQEAIAKASPMISDKARDLPCELEGLVSQVDKRFEPGTTTMMGYSVMTRSEKIRAGGATFYSYYNILFDKGESEKVAKLRRGEKIKIAGTTTGAGLMPGSQSPFFVIGVRAAKLK